MANQMRAIVRERLAAGERPEQVIQYFVDKYGQWILLSPQRHGFTLLVWVVPMVATLIGLAVVAMVVRKWTRRGPAHAQVASRVDTDMSERIRREMEAGP
jgi:cytochrome c-type biogenesis protein CcmH